MNNRNNANIKDELEINFPETLSKIYKLEHILNDIKNNTMTFAHPSSFEDSMELQQEHLYFIQCLSTEDSEYKENLWRTYSADKSGVKILFNTDVLKGEAGIFSEQVQKNKDLETKNIIITWFPSECVLAEVQYLKTDEEIYTLKKEVDKNLPDMKKKDIYSYLTNKRKKYAYEKEWRFIIDLSGKRFYDVNIEVSYDKDNDRNVRIIKIPFKHWDRIIKEIQVDPLASDNYLEHVKEKFYINGLPFQIKRSQTYYPESERGKSFENINFQIFMGKDMLDNLYVNEIISNIKNTTTEEQLNDYVKDVINNNSKEILWNGTFDLINKSIKQIERKKKYLNLKHFILIF